MPTELPLHDASFDGIVTHGGNATIYLTRSDATGCYVELLGVRELKMDDFQQGNIVVEFAVTRGEPVSPHVDLRRLLPPPHPSASSEYHSKYEKFVCSKLSEIAAGKLVFVEVIPAIGAELMAICEDITLRTHGPDRKPTQP